MKPTRLKASEIEALVWSTPASQSDAPPPNLPRLRDRFVQAISPTWSSGAVALVCRSWLGRTARSAG